MRLVIAGGGTGGHLFPGVALAEELLARDGEHEVLFVGAKDGLEERVLPRHGYRLVALPSLKGLGANLQLCRKALQACRGYVQARRAILDFHPHALIGLGGYASALPLLAGWGVEIPCMMLEQNAVPGRVTRKLACFAEEVGVQFPQAARYLSNPRKVKHVGNPLRPRLVQAAWNAAQKNLEVCPVPDEPVLLVLGGSQGAHYLNTTVVEVWPKLKKTLPSLRVVLVCGREEEARTADAFAAAGVRGQVVPFTEAMEGLYGQAHVVLARAGATTLAEIAAFALPSVLIPYPYAAENHQVVNARIFHEAGAATMFVQSEVEADRLVRRIADAVLQPERRRRMAGAAASLAKPYAATEVLDRLERLAGLKVFKTSPPPPACKTDSVRASVA
jgi:UDP-N-acetylglucosamine--N-acetylmuramyl-(pentapeptide) pyrophosphoryl-undecaprenol N-acetylglucosamine transferase